MHFGEGGGGRGVGGSCATWKIMFKLIHAFLEGLQNV